MQLTTLRSKTRFLLGELSTTQYSNTNLDRSLNDYYHQAVEVALKASGQWEINGEIATTDIVANQQEYQLPISLISLKKVEANFTNETFGWQQLNIYDLRDRSETSNDNAQAATTNIENCDLYDTSIFLQYKPLSNVTAGLKIYYSSEPTELSNDSDEPGLPESLQTYLVYGACIDYALRTENDSDYNKYIGLLIKKEDEIKSHYSNRLTAVRPRFQTRTEDYS